MRPCSPPKTDNGNQGTGPGSLRPGKYTLVVTASPVDGGAGQTSTAPFRIVR